MTHPALDFLTPRTAPTGSKADAMNAVCECCRNTAAVILRHADNSDARSEALGHLIQAYDAACTAILKG